MRLHRNGESRGFKQFENLPLNQCHMAVSDGVPQRRSVASTDWRNGPDRSEKSLDCRHSSPQVLCSIILRAAEFQLIPEIKMPSNVVFGTHPPNLPLAGSDRDEQSASQNWRSCTGSRTFQAGLDSSPRCGAEWRSQYCQVTEVSYFLLAPAAGPLARTAAYLAARVPPALLFDSRSDMLWLDHFRGVAHCRCISGRCRCSLARRPRPISS